MRYQRVHSKKAGKMPRLRNRLLVAALLAILIGGLVLAAVFAQDEVHVGGSRRTASTSTTRLPPRDEFAFRTQDSEHRTGAVGLVNGGVIRSWMPGGSLLFSDDGRILITSQGRDIYAQDVLTHRITHHRVEYDPQGCAAGLAVSGDYLTVADPGLVSYRLPDFAEALPIPSHLPRGPTCPVASIGSYIYATVIVATGFQLYKVDRSNGKTYRISQHALRDDHGASVAELNPVVYQGRNGSHAIMAYEDFSKADVDEIWTIDLTDGKMTRTDMSALGLDPADGKKKVVIYGEDYWWSETGKLYATMSSTSRTNTSVAPRQLWQLSDNRWIKAESPSWTQVRILPDGRRVVVSPSVGEVGVWGDLYLEQGSGLRFLNREVSAITTPAFQSLPSHSSRSPTLGLVWGRDQQGYGTVRPESFEQGDSGDVTGDVSSITWTSWGGERAVGHGTGWTRIPNPKAGSLSDGHVIQVEVEVIAFNLRLCVGENAYSAIEWFAPSVGQKFDPQHYRDICTGQYS